MTHRGEQFNWEGATIPGTKGGRRAHPPKVLHMLTRLKINKKEMETALISALSATANAKFVVGKYARLKDEKIKALPFIIDGKVLGLKTKEMIKTKVLKFNVQIGSSMETKELTLNKISVKSLEDSLGPDTEKWAGQTCIVESVKTVQFGEIKKMNILTLTAWDAEKIKS